MKINLTKWYPTRQAAGYLGVTDDTVKDYCRKGKLAGKRIGPKSQWHVKGISIAKKLKEWGLDDLKN